MRKISADTVVVGGGAAGMLAAITAAVRGQKTVVIEHSEYTGKKLGITGKGRCNVTNNCSVCEVMDNVPTNGRFLFSALNGFTPSEAMEYFETLGVPLKTERGGRVFPVSDRAADIVCALRREMKRRGVKVLYENAEEILESGGAVIGVKTGETEIECRNVIICTGGASYPATGSTGDGYRFALALGHTVTEPKPSLVPLVSKDHVCAELQGLSLKNIRITVFDGGKRAIFEDFGELLFTHFGLSGPLILSASAHISRFDGDSCRVSIDLKPALDEKTLDKRILRDFEKYSNRDFSNALGDLLPRKMVPVIVERSGVPPETKVNSVTRAQRSELIKTLKAFDITISGTRSVEDAIITRGGVSVKEIDPKTMESKLVTGLFFAGEVIDVDAYTGGFNLQIAWSTAYAAGSHTR
ncbi:MAG: NAD(P)/FAD-dependent oxidoreductase [Oscillospiraceae bacterium]|nr:NAD(P)/FAD-dependent oxidoreductase [Oscillospiraceae bacterium]